MVIGMALFITLKLVIALTVFYYTVEPVRPSLPRVDTCLEEAPCCGSDSGVLEGLNIFPLFSTNVGGSHRSPIVYYRPTYRVVRRQTGFLISSPSATGKSQENLVPTSNFNADS